MERLELDSEDSDTTQRMGREERTRSTEEAYRAGTVVITVCAALVCAVILVLGQEKTHQQDEGWMAPRGQEKTHQQDEGWMAPRGQENTHQQDDDEGWMVRAPPTWEERVNESIALGVYDVETEQCVGTPDKRWCGGECCSWLGDDEWDSICGNDNNGARHLQRGGQSRFRHKNRSN
eukprot:scaffold796_cov70-Cylindrotheca_fusiformis.AAC.2